MNENLWFCFYVYVQCKFWSLAVLVSDISSFDQITYTGLEMGFSHGCDHKGGSQQPFFCVSIRPFSEWWPPNNKTTNRVIQEQACSKPARRQSFALTSSSVWAMMVWCGRQLKHSVASNFSRQRLPEALRTWWWFQIGCCCTSNIHSGASCLFTST